MKAYCICSLININSLKLVDISLHQTNKIFAIERKIYRYEINTL